MQKARVTLFVIVTVFMVGVIAWSAVSAQTEETPRSMSIEPEVVGNEHRIFVEDDQSGLRTLVATVDLERDVHPLFRAMMSISPDGDYLLYVTAESTSLKNAQLFRAATDGGGVEKIATFEEDLWTVAPVWSPDSKKLALVREASADDKNVYLDPWVLDIKNSSLRKIEMDRPLTADMFLVESGGVLAWSDDGNALQLVDRFDAPAMTYKIDLETGVQSSWESPEKSIAGNERESADALPCGVPLYNQRAHGQIMQTCGRSISAAGCALTSATMAAKYYGVNIDPPTMNSRLGNSACPLSWYAVVNSNVTEGRMTVSRYHNDFTYDRLQADLNSGRPPIVWVTKGCSGTTGTHFVVVTGGSGSNPASYSINDPGDGNRRTLAYYTNNGYCLRRIDTFAGTPACSDADGGDIAYGQSKNGSVNPSRDYDDYFFNGTAGDNLTIRMSKRNSGLDSYVVLYNSSGSIIKSDDDSGGNRNSKLVARISSSGRYKIRASGYGTSTGNYTLQLTKEAASDTDDRRWLSFGRTLSGNISPSNDRDLYYFSGSAGTVVSVRMNKTGSSTLDSILELYDSSGRRIALNDDGGGNRNSWLVKELPANGTYRLISRSYGYRSSGSYSVSLARATSNNLALNRGARASSVEFRGVEPYKAFDGRTNTRWSSSFRDPGWIYVDLGSVRTFNKVILRWENAYARKYGIYVWNGSSWRFLWGTNSGNGGIDTITFSPASGRYVMMYGLTRGTRWGYSLWEFGIYNSASLLFPLVPPDPVDKEADTIEPLAPLGPNDDDKKVMLIGEGDDAQEDFPLAGELDEDLPANEIGTSIPYAEIVSPNELDEFYTEVGYFRFDGYGEDNDEDGESIVAYSWRSSIDGTLSSKQSFTLPYTVLSDGLHTIYFKVQDNEGDWSEETSIPLSVDNRSYYYLPMIR